MSLTKNLKAAFVLLIFLINCGFCFSENFQKDSSKKNQETTSLSNPAEIYCRLSSDCHFNDPPKAIGYAKKALAIYTNNKEELNEAKADFLIAVSYKDLGIYDSALLYYNVCYNKRIQYKDTTRLSEERIGEAKNGIGVIYSMEGRYDDALAVFMEVKNIYDEKGDSINIAKVLNNIAILYYSINQSDKALIYYQKSLEIKERLHITASLNNTLMNVAVIYTEKKQYEKSKEYLNKALKYAQEVDNQPDISTAYYEFGELYMDQSQYELAISYEKKSLQIREGVGDDSGIAACLIDIGRCYSNLGDDKNAIANYKNGLEYAHKTGIFQQLSELNDLISGAYMDEGDYKNAYKYLRDHITYHDSLFNGTNASKIAELQEKYEAKEKEKSIEKLNIEKANQEIELYKKKIQINYILAISILVILLVLFFYYRYSLKLKNARIEKEMILNVERIKIIEENRILKEKQQKELLNVVIDAQEEERRKIALDIHDSLGQLLSGVKLNLQLALNDKNISSEIEDVLKNAQELNNDSIAESKNIASDLLPYNIKDFGLVAAIKNLCYKNNQLKISNINFYSNDVPRKLPGELEIAIYRIAQELINNALKHAKATEIFVQLFYREQKLILQIEDNGIGFTQAVNETKLNSMGLKNIASRVQLLEGHLEIDSVLNKGTTTLVEFSLIL